jgi:hypothetical protein
VTVGLDGSHAELRAVAEPFCWKIPDGLSTEEAACVPCPSGRPTTACSSSGTWWPGETALIHAGASGVGIAAIQLAKRAGARVWPRRQRREAGTAEGARSRRGHQLRHHRLRRGGPRLTEGRGADVIVDSVGGRPCRGASVPGLPGSVRHRRRRRPTGNGADGHLHPAAQQPVPLGLLPGGRAVLEPPSPRHDRPPPRRHRRRARCGWSSTGGSRWPTPPRPTPTSRAARPSDGSAPALKGGPLRASGRGSRRGAGRTIRRGGSAHRCQAAAISPISSGSTKPSSTAWRPSADSVIRSAQRSPHQSRSSGSEKHQADAVAETSSNPAARAQADQPAAAVGLPAVVAGHRP